MCTAPAIVCQRQTDLTMYGPLNYSSSTLFFREVQNIGFWLKAFYLFATSILVVPSLYGLNSPKVAKLYPFQPISAREATRE